MGETGIRYDEDFKREAVNLVATTGKSAAAIARDLGISDASLYAWIKQAKPYGKLTEEGKELARLRKELADVRLERDVLKKAVAIFSKQPR